MYQIQWEDNVDGNFNFGIYNEKYNTREEAITSLLTDIMSNYKDVYDELGFNNITDFKNSLITTLKAGKPIQFTSLDHTYKWRIAKY